MNYHKPPASVESAPVYLAGKILSRSLRRMPAARRAIWAYRAEAGGLTIGYLSRSQSAQIFKVSHGYINTIAKLSPEQRDHVWAHPSLLTRHHHRKRELTDSALAKLTDAELDALIAKMPARVMQSLDRLTSPAIAAE